MVEKNERRIKEKDDQIEEEKNASNQKICRRGKPLGIEDIKRAIEYERIHGPRQYEPMKIYVHGKSPYEELKKKAERILAEDTSNTQEIIVSPIVLIIFVILFILAILD